MAGCNGRKAMDKIIASLAKEGGWRLLTAMLFGGFLFGSAALAWSLIAETLFPTTRSHGQECALVTAACAAMGAVAGFVIEGMQCRQWHWTLLSSLFMTSLVGLYFTY